MSKFLPLIFMLLILMFVFGIIYADRTLVSDSSVSYKPEHSKTCRDGLCVYKYTDGFVVCYSLYSQAIRKVIDNKCFLH